MAAYFTFHSHLPIAGVFFNEKTVYGDIIDMPHNSHIKSVQFNGF